MSSICVFKFSALMLNTTLYEKTYNFFKFFFQFFGHPSHKKILNTSFNKYKGRHQKEKLQIW